MPSNTIAKSVKKALVDGRALCGHMKDYGISSDPENGDDEYSTSNDWDGKFGGGGNGNGDLPPVTKRMYALRTNPNRLKRCRDCSIGGKNSSSGKSLLGHEKCGYDDVNDSSLMSGWSKRKRSFRATIESDNTNRPSNEEQDLADSLIMLSNSIAEGANVTELEESYTSASKEDERGVNKPLKLSTNNTITTVDASYKVSAIADNKGKSVATPPKGMFECKACKKVFSSHQALGGHRASHKKVKGCFAAKLDQETIDDSNLADDQDTTTNEELYFPSKNNNLRFDCDPNNQQVSNSKKKSKVHQCSICNRVFSSGQALGGHKRCHWITSNLVADTSATSLVAANYHHLRDQIEQQIQQNSSKFINNSKPVDLALDLNLPAPVDQQSSSFTDISSKIHLQSWVNKEQLENNVYHQNHLQHNNNRSTQTKKDEDDNKVHLPKLSELKDMNINDGSSSPWLQVGIGSANDQVRADSIDFCKANGTTTKNPTYNGS